MRTVPAPRLLRRCTQGLLLLAVLGLTGWWAGTPPPAGPAWRPLVHWRGDGRDWLLVADTGAGRVAIYDARDGRPLGALGRADGVTVARGLALHADTLWVLGGEAPERIRLPAGIAPESSALALAGRHD